MFINLELNYNLKEACYPGANQYEAQANQQLHIEIWLYLMAMLPSLMGLLLLLEILPENKCQKKHINRCKMLLYVN